jgi:hypothetical protein
VGGPAGAGAGDGADAKPDGDGAASEPPWAADAVGAELEDGAEPNGEIPSGRDAEAPLSLAASLPASLGCSILADGDGPSPEGLAPSDWLESGFVKSGLLESDLAGSALALSPAGGSPLDGSSLALSGFGWFLKNSLNGSAAEPLGASSPPGRPRLLSFCLADGLRPSAPPGLAPSSGGSAGRASRLPLRPGRVAGSAAGGGGSSASGLATCLGSGSGFASDLASGLGAS